MWQLGLSFKDLNLIFDPEVVPDDIDNVLLEGVYFEGQLLRRAKVVERSTDEILSPLFTNTLLPKS